MGKGLGVFFMIIGGAIFVYSWFNLFILSNQVNPLIGGAAGGIWALGVLLYFFSKNRPVIR